MPNIALLNITPDLAAEVHDRERFERAHGVTVGGSHARLAEAVAETEAFRRRQGAAPRWGGYVVVDATSHAVVGTCAFKGDPDGSGAVEIAYLIFPGFEGRGYASAVAAALSELAARSGEVRLVVAHTLPRPNASARVLAKTGFAHVGQDVHPDDGPVWRWELPVGARRPSMLDRVIRRFRGPEHRRGSRPSSGLR